MFLAMLASASGLSVDVKYQQRMGCGYSSKASRPEVESIALHSDYINIETYFINFRTWPTIHAHNFALAALLATEMTASKTAHLAAAPPAPFEPSPISHHTHPPVTLPSRSKLGFPLLIPLNCLSFLSV